MTGRCLYTDLFSIHPPHKVLSSDAQYQWVIEALGVRPVQIVAFARMNFVHTVLSKRKLTWFVENKHVEGWNDPRFPTVQGVLRRGVQVDALREFILGQGFSKR